MKLLYPSMMLSKKPNKTELKFFIINVKLSGNLFSALSLGNGVNSI